MPSLNSDSPVSPVHRYFGTYIVSDFLTVQFPTTLIEPGRWTRA